MIRPPIQNIACRIRLTPTNACFIHLQPEDDGYLLANPNSISKFNPMRVENNKQIPATMKPTCPNVSQRSEAFTQRTTTQHQLNKGHRRFEFKKG